MRKCREKFSKVLEICNCRGLGGGAPEASEIIKNLVEKSTETCDFLKIFMNYEQHFLFKQLILIIR